MPCDRACLWPTYLHAEGREALHPERESLESLQGLAPHVWNDHVGQRATALSNSSPCFEFQCPPEAPEIISARPHLRLP